MCNVCEKKVTKAEAISYRIRISGRVILVHPDCEAAIAADSRAVKEAK